MAGQISEPASTNPDTTEWQKLLAKLTKTTAGFALVGLTNFDTSAEPYVAVGSRFEINGAFYEVAVEESITGWSGIAVGPVFVYAVPGSASCTFAYSSIIPIFVTARGGWYNGNNRALFQLYKSSATSWDSKRVLDVQRDERVRREEFLASGVFLVPPAVRHVFITGCARGMDGVAGSSYGGSGGAGGGYEYKTKMNVVPGTAITVTIGTSNGSNSAFGGLILYAGAGGAGSAGGAGAKGEDRLSGGGYGIVSGGGGGGGSLGVLAKSGANPTAGVNGGAAGSFDGGGGGGVSSSGVAGNGGNGGYGGGGGGGCGTVLGQYPPGAGGQGGPAIIIVEW